MIRDDGAQLAAARSGWAVGGISDDLHLLTIRCGEVGYGFPRRPVVASIALPRFGAITRVRLQHVKPLAHHVDASARSTAPDC
ncbi:MAG: hypothetical protein U0Y68_22185 [Blastocatellia bacterium]